MTLVPAYGRDYKNAQEVKAAWEANKDFVICDISAGADDGRYINLADASRDGKIQQVKIRYKRLTAFVLIKVIPDVLD